jgi:EAL domain-containing protein (putative c-di-GMP-specific phosphodiesterase class I)
MIKAIVSLAHGFNVIAIGEGVETEAQYQVLQDSGCDYAQGFFLGKPITSDEMTFILKVKAPAD